MYLYRKNDKNELNANKIRIKKEKSKQTCKEWVRFSDKKGYSIDNFWMLSSVFFGETYP